MIPRSAWPLASDKKGPRWWEQFIKSPTDEVSLYDPLHLVSGVMNEWSAVEDPGVVDQDVDVTDLGLDHFGNLV